jgi:dihydroorotase
MSALELAIEKGFIKDEEVTEEVLENFLGKFGRKFYGVQDGSGERIILRRGEEKVIDILESKSGDVKVVPFRRGNATWSVEWKN